MPGHDDHGAGHGDPHAGHGAGHADPHAAHGGGGSHHGTYGPGAGHAAHGAGQGGDARPEVDFLINGRAFAMDEILFEGRVGEVEEWEVFNNSHMDHPFHVHGTHFQVVASRDGDGEWREAPWLAWKDTVNLAPYQRLDRKSVV